MAAGQLGGAGAALPAARTIGRRPQLPPLGQKPREMLASGPLGSAHTLEQWLLHLLQLARIELEEISGSPRQALHPPGFQL